MDENLFWIMGDDIYYGSGYDLKILSNQDIIDLNLSPEDISTLSKRLIDDRLPVRATEIQREYNLNILENEQ
jgi:hypothetical protein